MTQRLRRHSPAGSAALALLLGAAAATAGCSLGAERSAPDVVSPAQASQVANAFWQANEKANMARDRKLQGEHEDGPAGAMDDARYQADAATGSVLQKAPRRLRSVFVYVPHQDRFPAQFAAILSTDSLNDAGLADASKPLIFLNIFTRAGVAAPWRTTFEATLDKPLRLFTGADGYVSPWPVRAQLAIAPKEVAALYTRYVTGATSDPRIAATGRLSTERQTAAQRRNALNAAGTAESLAGADSAPFSDLYAYPTLDGGAVVMATSALLDRYAPKAADMCLVQTATQPYWNGLVRPGRFHEVAFRLLADVVFIDPPHRAGNTTDLVGLYSAAVSAQTSAGLACG